MGMGLSLCKTIIEAHDGQLSAQPNLPQGAIFAFQLPAAGRMGANLHATYDDSSSGASAFQPSSP